MTEATALPFDTPLGPVLPAAMYLATCAWPDSYPQRSKLVEALLHGGARAAGYRHQGPALREVQRKLNRATERLRNAFQAAEVAQLAVAPAELRIPVTIDHADRYAIGKYEPGILRLQLPSFPAMGRDGKPSVKRLQALAAGGWNKPADARELALGDDDFRKRIWRRFLPALPYIIPLKMHVQDAAEPLDVVTLVRDTAWLDSCLDRAESWRSYLSRLEAVPADFLHLIRT